MSGRYATTTKVPVAQSRADVEELLERYGADQFAYSNESGLVQIAFRLDGRFVRMKVPMPLADEPKFAKTPTGMVAADSTRKANFDQAVRSRWRAVVLVLKAKLEAVDIGITTLEREFLADTVMPDGRTVGDVVVVQIRDAYLTGEQPRLLLQ